MLTDGSSAPGAAVKKAKWVVLLQKCSLACTLTCSIHFKSREVFLTYYHPPSRRLTAMGGDPGLISNRSIFGGTLNGIQAGGSLAKRRWTLKNIFSQVWLARLSLIKNGGRRRRSTRTSWFLRSGKQNCRTNDWWYLRNHQDKNLSFIIECFTGGEARKVDDGARAC